MECHACGAEISEKAADCPQCGASVRDLAGGEGTERQDPPDPGDADDGARESGRTESSGGTGSDHTTPNVPGTESSRPDARDAGTRLVGDESGETTDAPSERGDTGGTSEREGASEPDVGVGDAGSGDSTTEPDTGDERADGSTGEGGPETGSGWEAAGPPPDEPETGVSRESTTGAEGGTGSQEPTVPGTDEPTTTGTDEPATTGTTDLDGAAESGGRAEFGSGAGRGDQSPETDERAASDAPGESSSTEELDPVEQIKGLPFLTAPLAGVVTAGVVAVLSVVVGVLVPNAGLDPVTMGGLVAMDLHFATSSHVTTGILTQFDTARPPDSVLGLLYLLPPLFLYTAAKFVAAYNTDESTLTPVAGLGGSLVAVGYFPAMLVALFLAPGGPFSPVSLLPAVLLAGIAYPVFFGFVGGLAGGGFSGSERRISTLYAVVAFFVVAIGAFALTFPSIQVGDVGLLPQIHASLYTVVAANGFSVGGADTGLLVLLAYPLVAFVVFAAGFLRAWNADDVAGPVRGIAKGLGLAVTYFTLLGLLATVLPLLADPWVVDELGFSFAEAALVQNPVETEFYEIGRYVTVVFVGTLVYAVFLAGVGGTIAGTARYLLSDEN